jgi:hypothetical protein
VGKVIPQGVKIDIEGCGKRIEERGIKGYPSIKLIEVYPPSPGRGAAC